MVAPQPFFEPRGTPLSVLGRLKALTRLGHEVDLLTYHVGQDVEISGVTIHRTPKIGFIKSVRVGPSYEKIFLDILLFFKTIRFLLKGKYDLLHTHEEASVFGVLLAKLFKIRHLYDMHSSPTEQLSNFRLTRFHPLIRLFDFIEGRVINASDALITICPALENRVRRINGRVPQVMIENVAIELDPTTIPEEELHTFRAAHPRLNGIRIVFYAGTFEAYQGIDLLIASADRVLRQRDDVLFVLAGGKPDQIESYRRRTSELGLSPRFYFTGTRPPEEIPLFIRLSDVLVSPRTDGTNTPLKIYSYLQSGKPIVATNLHTHTQVLNSDVAMLVAPEPQAFAQGILTLLEDPQLAASRGAAAQRLFKANYSFQIYVRKTDHALRLALG